MATQRQRINDELIRSVVQIEHCLLRCIFTCTSKYSALLHVKNTQRGEAWVVDKAVSIDIQRAVHTSGKSWKSKINASEAGTPKRR
tara:strand:+ start:258 stop:515 length:258 start_codon:yes stop_codon:yes gene_type:complete